MLTFKQYLIENSIGNYVSIGLMKPLPDFKLAQKYGGSKVCEFEDQHVTLIYSKESSVPIPRVQKFIDSTFTKTPIYADILKCEAFDSVPKDGERDDNLCTIVLKIHSPELNAMHEGLKSLGMSHSYPVYSAHISLLYDFPRDQKDEVIEHISKYLEGGMKTQLSGYKSDVIKKNWTNKLSEEVRRNVWEFLTSTDKDINHTTLIDLVGNAYKHTSLGSFVTSVNDVKNSEWLALDYDPHPGLDICVFYRKPRTNEKWKGFKIQGIGHDGTRESKNKLLNKIAGIIRGGNFWIEASDGMANALIKLNVPIETDKEKLKAIFPTIVKFNDDGSYVRSIDGANHTEYVFGKIKLWQH